MDGPQDIHPPSQGWSPTIKNHVEGSVLQTLNLASRLNSQNEDQVTSVLYGQSPFPGWSPTIQKEIIYPQFKTYLKHLKPFGTLFNELKCIQNILNYLKQLSPV